MSLKQYGLNTYGMERNEYASSNIYLINGKVTVANCVGGWVNTNVGYLCVSCDLQILAQWVQRKCNSKLALIISTMQKLV